MMKLVNLMKLVEKVLFCWQIICPRPCCCGVKMLVSRIWGSKWDLATSEQQKNFMEFSTLFHPSEMFTLGRIPLATRNFLWSQQRWCFQVNTWSKQRWQLCVQFLAGVVACVDHLQVSCGKAHSESYYLELWFIPSIHGHIGECCWV